MIAVASPLRPLWVEQQHGTEWWIVRADYHLLLIINGKRYVLRLPAGWRYNRASIPPAVEWIVSKDDLGCHGPGAHDALCEARGELPSAESRDFDEAVPSCTPRYRFSKAEADEILLAVCLADECDPEKTDLAFHAVRLFGRRW